jgi:hypothetical protein
VRGGARCDYREERKVTQETSQIKEKRRNKARDKLIHIHDNTHNRMRNRGRYCNGGVRCIEHQPSNAHMSLSPFHLMAWHGGQNTDVTHCALYACECIGVERALFTAHADCPIHRTISHHIKLCTLRTARHITSYCTTLHDTAQRTNLNSTALCSLVTVSVLF